MLTTTSSLTPATHGLRVAASFNPRSGWFMLQAKAVSLIRCGQSRFRREEHLAAALPGFRDRFRDLFGDVSLTPSSASVIRAFRVSAVTRCARSGPSTRVTSPPSASTSSTTSSRRTILTVFRPSNFATAIVARPTPELAPFWITHDPGRQFHDVC
jgi:hypothetical protein